MTAKAPLIGDASEQAQTLEIVTLAGGLAHEIRNPLSTISMNIQLLVEELQSSTVQRDQRMLARLVTVQNECRHLEQTLSDFTQFIRLGQIEGELLDLSEVLRRFISFITPEARAQNVEISAYLSSDVPRVLLDERLFRQALLNLARNALQAMSEGGRLEFQTFAKEGAAVLTVIDTGPGISEKVLSRMYEPFFSTKVSGSGLGLPLVKRIVEAHRGMLDCETSVGRGTKFVVTLPAAG